LVQRNSEDGARRSKAWCHVHGPLHVFHNQVRAVREQHNPKDQVRKEEAKLIDGWNAVIHLRLGPHSTVVQENR